MGTKTEHLSLEFGDEGRRTYELLTPEYLATLLSPADDMWATFADQAQPAAIVQGKDTVGSISVDDSGELHRFFIRPGFEHLSAHALSVVEQQSDIRSMIVSTADPLAASTTLPRASSINAVALLYDHHEPPQGSSLNDIRHAVESDHPRSTEFLAAANDGSPEFIDAYVAARIDRRELFVHDIGGQLAAIGERRLDRHTVGYAHLGIVVGEEHRGRGIGSAMMNSLVAVSERERLTPLCSTEPGNLAAQTLIRRAGFRSRHTVFRLRARPHTETLED